MTNLNEEITFNEFQEWLKILGIDLAVHLSSFGETTYDRLKRLIDFEISSGNMRTRKGWVHYYAYDLLVNLAPRSKQGLVSEFILGVNAVAPELWKR